MVSAIIVAAGMGTRMEEVKPKQFLMLEGRPILTYSLQTFDACKAIDNIFLVIREEDFDFCRTRILMDLDLQKDIKLVPGGLERQDSVYNGLSAVASSIIDEDKGIVLVHDSVRPFVREAQISSCINGAKEFGACILGIPAFDTLKRLSPSGDIIRTMNRDTVWLAQTPQAFQYNLIKKAHDDAAQEGYYGTDEASLVERSGHIVKMIKGSKTNIKITTKEDFLLASAIAKMEGI